MSTRKRPEEPPRTSSDESSSFFSPIEPVPSPRQPLVIRDPLWKLRRTNTIVGLLGGGCLSIGSCLVIAFYVTGPPNLNDLATSVTAILFLLLVAGCLACLPSWISASIVLFGQKPSRDTYPPHAKLLRLLCLISTWIATIEAILAIVLYVLLQEKQSFIDFCLVNVKRGTEEACVGRWNRNWVIILSSALVLLYHIAFGFPLYRYTRGPQGGTQLQEGFLLELSHRDEEEEEEGRGRRREEVWSTDDEESGSSSDESDKKSELGKRRRERRRRREKERGRFEEW